MKAKLLFLLGGLLAFAGEATAQTVTTKRCGWYENPTPANAWLVDRHGQWIIGAQGAYQAGGNRPTFRKGQWVSTNGSYGYGCACMDVVTRTGGTDVERIRNAKAVPLAQCRNDKALSHYKPGQ